MREVVSQLVMWAGIAIALYGIGLRIEWVVALLAVAFVATCLYWLRSVGILPRADITRQPTETTPKGNNVDVSAEVDDEPEAAWKKFSVLRVPGNHGLNDTTVHAVHGELKDDQSTAPAPPPTKPEVSGADTAQAKAQPSPTTTNRTESPQIDPLAIYRPEQFNAPPRAAPVEASPPAVAISPNSMPTGPAYVPPVTRSVPDRAARSPETRRPQRPILKPEDFTRNAGRPGFLYLARNPEHWDGLFKVGQTLRHPSKRVGELNTLHAKHKDIGTFDLLDVVEVPDAYGAEQVLFLVLSDLRPVAGREFFIADKAYLSKLMRAVADFVSWRPEELNDLYRDLDPINFPAWPGYVQRHHYRSVKNARGWVYLARNQYHKADTYLFGSTRNCPQSEVDELNAGQRTDTPQIGFFTVVFALPVWDTRMSRAIGWRALAPWRLHGSRSYVRGPLDQLSNSLVSGLSASEN